MALSSVNLKSWQRSISYTKYRMTTVIQGEVYGEMKSLFLGRICLGKEPLCYPQAETNPWQPVWAKLDVASAEVAASILSEANWLFVWISGMSCPEGAARN